MKLTSEQKRRIVSAINETVATLTKEKTTHSRQFWNWELIESCERHLQKMAEMLGL